MATRGWDLTNLDSLAQMKLYDARTTLVVNGPARTDLSNRTYIITGSGRGGTTMVTGVAHLLGLELNPGGVGNLEDPQFVNVAQGRRPEKGKTHEPHNLSREETVEYLRNRVITNNQHNSVWGWKDPGVDSYLTDISSELRNPHFIVVYRDPIAVATALIAADETNVLMAEKDPLRHKVGTVITPEQAYNMVTQHYSRYWELLNELKWPTLLVSYERGRSQPLQLAAEMADFLGLELTAEVTQNILAYVSNSGGYFHMPQAMNTILNKNPIAEVLKPPTEPTGSDDALPTSDKVGLITRLRSRFTTRSTEKRVQ